MESSLELIRHFNGLSTNSTKKPLFQRIREIPSTLNLGAIERAIRVFIEESAVHADTEGFFNQTLQSVAEAIIFKVKGTDFWMAESEGEVCGYALTRIVRDIDNKLCLWVAQGWIRKDFRNGSHIRQAWKTLEEWAKRNMCSHIVNVTNRNPKVYLRLLGEGWHEYSTLLKKDL